MILSFLGGIQSMITSRGPAEFECAVCGAGFRKLYNCKRHVKEVHMKIRRAEEFHNS